MEFQLKNQQFQKNQLNQQKILLFLLRERPLMMSDYRGMTPQNLTLESKNWTLGGNGGSKFVKTSSDIIYGCPLDGFQTFVFESHWQNFKSFYSQH